jgi:RNA polymerase-binding transcription factor DksA
VRFVGPFHTAPPARERQSTKASRRAPPSGYRSSTVREEQLDALITGTQRCERALDRQQDGRDQGLKRVNCLSAALDRMNEGEYGTCVECDEPISLARLDAMREVQICVRCQARLNFVIAFGALPDRSRRCCHQRRQSSPCT